MRLGLPEARWQRPWQAGQNDRRFLCTFLLCSLTVPVFQPCCVCWCFDCISYVEDKEHFQSHRVNMNLLQYHFICSASAARKQPEALLLTPARVFGVGSEGPPFLKHWVPGGARPSQGGDTRLFSEVVVSGAKRGVGGVSRFLLSQERPSSFREPVVEPHSTSQPMSVSSPAVTVVLSCTDCQRR